MGDCGWLLLWPPREEVGLCEVGHPSWLGQEKGYVTTSYGPDAVQTFSLPHLKGTVGERPLAREWVWMAQSPWKQHTRKRISVKHLQGSESTKRHVKLFHSSVVLPRCLSSLGQSQAAWWDVEVPCSKMERKPSTLFPLQMPGLKLAWAGAWKKL